MKVYILIMYKSVYIFVVCLLHSFIMMIMIRCTKLDTYKQVKLYVCFGLFRIAFQQNISIFYQDDKYIMSSHLPKKFYLLTMIPSKKRYVLFTMLQYISASFFTDVLFISTVHEKSFQSISNYTSE
jgi:hypothetical protein